MAYVERQRGGRHMVGAETGIDECSGWQAVCALEDIPDGQGRPVMLKGTDVAVMRTVDRVFAVGGTSPKGPTPIRRRASPTARRTDLEYML